jgi:hypothetical protein
LAGDIHPGSAIDFSSVAGMRSNQLNWGPTFGALKALRLPFAHVRDGHAAMGPRRDDGTLEILTMEKNVITRLKDDKEWMAWRRRLSADIGRIPLTVNQSMLWTCRVHCSQVPWHLPFTAIVGRYGESSLGTGIPSYVTSVRSQLH